MNTPKQFLEIAKSVLDETEVTESSTKIGCNPDILAELQKDYMHKVVCTLEISIVVNGISTKALDMVCLDRMEPRLVRMYIKARIEKALRKGYTQALGEHIRGGDNIDSFNKLNT